MANDIDELSIRVTESSASSTQNINGNSINTTNGNINVIIPTTISVANAVSKIDAAQNPQNTYTVVKKQRSNLNLSGNVNLDLGNSNNLTAIASIPPNNLNNSSSKTAAITKSISNNLLLTTATSVTSTNDEIGSEGSGNDSKINSRSSSHQLTDSLGRDNNSNIGKNGSTSSAINIAPSSSNGYSVNNHLNHHHHHHHLHHHHKYFQPGKNTFCLFIKISCNRASISHEKVIYFEFVESLLKFHSPVNVTNCFFYLRSNLKLSGSLIIAFFNGEKLEASITYSIIYTF